MQRKNAYFDHPAPRLAYFREIDRRFAGRRGTVPAPADISFPTTTSLGNIRAVLWDVYGTLVGVDVGDLEQSLSQEQQLQQAAKVVIEEFHLRDSLSRLDPQTPSHVKLQQLYLKFIEQSHENSRRAGVESPEVRIENIWRSILLECMACGYLAENNNPAPRLDELSWRCAYLFDTALQRSYLYPGAAQALARLRDRGILQGIVSNAQFYTPLHLRRLLRTELNDDKLSIEDIFTPELIFFSYELGFSKPNPTAFDHALEYLIPQGITAAETVYIGNDMLNDVWTADQRHLRTCLFAGDKTQTRLREDDPRCADLQPDAACTHIKDIPALLTAP